MSRIAAIIIIVCSRETHTKGRQTVHTQNVIKANNVLIMSMGKGNVLRWTAKILSAIS